MKDVYVAWQDPKSRTWHTVGHLTHQESKFIFSYTKGAKKSAHFIPFDRMAILDRVYEADELFPVFSNRVLSKNRPEYSKFVRWLDLDEHNVEDLNLLAISGGAKATDQIRIIPTPSKTEDGRYQIRFFLHGLKYLPSQALDVLSDIKAGSELYILEDIQNKVDAGALAIRTDDPKVLLGYFPHYLNRDVKKIINYGNLESMSLKVARINDDAPVQYRYLCEFEASWPKGFKPYLSDEYQKIENA